MRPPYLTGGIVTSLHDLRSRVVDAPNSLAASRRARRWEWLQATFPDIGSMSIIDLGGTAESWRRAPIRPASVQVVNLDPPPLDVPDWIRADQADACRLPAHIARGSYDLVYSNSVLEHVGGHAERLRFADAVHRLADRHWVQTPYRYFPVEPHWLFPGFQFLPVTLRAEVSRRWPLVNVRSSSHEDGIRGALSVELLSRSEMAFYFPGSTLRFERLTSLIKSLIAVKS
jgi:hypothetical protein